MSKNKKLENKPKGSEPRGLRERVKGGWITAREAREELRAKDKSPNPSILAWLRRRGAN